MKTDRLTVQMVVAFIGAACLMTIGGLIGLSFVGRAIPDPLTALGGAAIGALSSLLARTATEGRFEGDSSNGSSLRALPQNVPPPPSTPSAPANNNTPVPVVVVSSGEGA